MAPSFDPIDRQILASLQENARISNKELAARVGLSQSSCLERVRQLQKKGILQGYHAHVDPKAMGVNLQAIVLVRLSKHSRKTVEAFRDAVLALPEVIGVFLVGGQHDFLIHLAVPSSDYLRNLELEHITTRPEVVHIETSLVFEYSRNPVLPCYMGSDPEAIR